MRDLSALLATPYNGRGIGYTCGELLKHISAGGALRSRLYTPYASRAGDGFEISQSAPKLIAKPLYRLSPTAARALNELSFRQAFDRDASRLAYLIGETTPRLDNWLRDNGVITVREKVNCSKQLSKSILDDAYCRLGLAPNHGLTSQAIEEEKERLLKSDFVFAPNRFVEQSLRDYGIPERNIIPTSYGFSSARLMPKGTNKYNFKGPTFLFVGTLCVRKGVHLLLDAWARASVNGTLVLAGSMEPVIREICRENLARNDVTYLEYVNDIGSLYREADVFVFPSLEEGGPQVTYEAAHCGLPSLTSPMGAGRIVRDGVEGLVIDPYDISGWADAIRTLASNSPLRQNMAAAALARSAEFDWAHVGAQRAADLILRLTERNQVLSR